MINRDFVMRQVHQLAQALARVLSLDIVRREDEGSQWLSRAVKDVTGTDLQRLRNEGESELAAVCSPGGRLSPDLAVALADILMEDARILESSGDDEVGRASRERAIFLYSLARDAGGTLPMAVLKMLSE